MKKNTVLKIAAVLISLVLAGIDRFTKELAVQYVKPYDTVPVLVCGDTEVLNLTYCENTGMSFSLLSGHRFILIALPLLLIAAVEFMIFSGKISRPRTVIALSALAGGGLGNLIDRIFAGYVVDFIDVRLINFAIFNFADICAVCGGICVAVFMIIDDFRSDKYKLPGPYEDDDITEESKSKHENS